LSAEVTKSNNSIENNPVVLVFTFTVKVFEDPAFKTTAGLTISSTKSSEEPKFLTLETLSVSVNNAALVTA